MRIYKNLLFSSLLIVSCAGHSTRGSFYDRMLQDDRGTMCADNPVCAAMGLIEGACCPNDDNEYLGCCNRECSAHFKCSNLDGTCCPTKDDVGLSCCDHQPALSALTSPSSSVSLTPASLPSATPSKSPNDDPSVTPSGDLTNNSSPNLPNTGPMESTVDPTRLGRSGNQNPYLVSFGGEPPAHVFPLQLCQGDCEDASDVSLLSLMLSPYLQLVVFFSHKCCAVHFTTHVFSAPTVWFAISEAVVGSKFPDVVEENMI